MNALFPANFLEAIEHLSIDVSRIASTGAAGAHLSKSAGASLDFRDYRTYSPGDDLRRVDWNVYRRTGHLFMRRFDQPCTAPIHLLIDTSKSMFVEDPSRYATAARIAAAIASAGLRTHDPVSIIPLGANVPPLHRISGRRRFPEVLEYLSDTKPSDAKSLSSDIDLAMSSIVSSGIVVVVSDLFNEDGAEKLVDTLAQIPARLVLIQIIQPFDSDPQLGDEEQLIDCETQHAAMVMPAAEVFARYREAYGAYQSILGHFSAGRGIRHERIDASRDTLAELEKLFPSGAMHLAEARR